MAVNVHELCLKAFKETWKHYTDEKAPSEFVDRMVMLVAGYPVGVSQDRSEYSEACKKYVEANRKGIKVS